MKLPQQTQTQQQQQQHPQRRPVVVVRARDTRAWRVQVWVGSGLAAALCAIGLIRLPGAEIDRAFMVMGYAFCLTSAFALAKCVRDAAEGRNADTPLWRLVLWSGFALAMALTGWGLWRLDVHPTWKAYLLVSWLYLISSAFTLAKTLRDGSVFAWLQRSGLAQNLEGLR